MKTAYLTAADFLGVLKKNILPILLAALLLGAAFGLGQAVTPPAYSATAEFYVRNLQSADFLEDYGLTSSQLAAVQSLAKEYASLVAVGDTLADLAIERHGLSVTREALQSMLSATSDSTVIRITANADTAELADRVIAAVTAEYPAWINETAWPYMHEDFSCVILLKEASAATRSSPSPILMGAVGLLIGAFLAYIFFLLRFLFGCRVMDTEEAARVLPEVPVVFTFPEEVSTLRSRILQAMCDKSHPVVGVIEEKYSSADFFTMLAASLAAAEHRVLMINMVSDAEKCGVLNCLSDESVTPESVISREAGDYLHVLPLGFDEDAATLLASPRAAELLKALAEGYDLVLLRFPAEAESLLFAAAPVLTACFAEVHAGKTTARRLRALRDTLNATGTALLGMAVTDTAHKIASSK